MFIKLTYRLVNYLGIRFLLKDEIYINLQYRFFTGKKLNLVNPKLFSEKIQFLKLLHKDQDFSEYVDKYEVKKLINKKIKGLNTFKTLDICDSIDELNFPSLPKSFVIKCTHDSGSTTIVKDKSEINNNSLKRKYNKYLKRNYYYKGLEYVYKNIKPRIIIEEFYKNENETQIIDYKFFCFNNEPKLVQLDTDRFTNHKRTFFDMNWNKLDLKLIYQADNKTIKQPNQFDRMVSFARQVCKLVNSPFLRVDLYVIERKIFFGEITFYPEGGYSLFEPIDFERKLGTKINVKK
tara:strand:+ start:691 stop:1566 length:876 start_codon:yes stop_codon:yes gene_type:complete